MYSVDITEVFKVFKATKTGLNSTEAEIRLNKYGENIIKKRKKINVFVCFFKQFLNIMVGILLFSSAVSIFLALYNHKYEDLFDGLVILFIVIMNAIIGVIQEVKADASIESLQKYDKTYSLVLRNGEPIRIESSKLVVGDIILLKAGDVVGADVRLIYTSDFSCDESMLTGESISVEKNADIILKKSTALADRINMAYSGSLVTTGEARGVVVATGKDTEIGKIAGILFSTKKESTPIQKSIDRIGRIITIVVMAVCVVILLVELITTHSAFNSIMISVSLAVAAIPESLPAVITLIMALGVQQLSKRKCIIRNLNAVETLGSCEVICTDKTGTLTLNKMEVVEEYSFSDDNTSLYKCMALCNNAKIIDNVVTGAPTEKALFEYALNKGINIEGKIIHEVQFSSARKMMTKVVYNTNYIAYTKGAPERVIDKCLYAMVNGEVVSLTQDLKSKIKSKIEDMGSRSLRVIALAYRDLDSFNSNMDYENNLVFLGLAGLMDNPRPEVAGAIARCKKAGLKPIMITGDNKLTALSIATKVGITNDTNSVITGEELDKMSDKELKTNLNRYKIFARVNPEHKVRIVKAYKSIGKIVAMTGDGVNDAPSLRMADIGVGMGGSGADVVKSVADMLITDDNFNSIVVAVEEGRKVYSNIQKALQFLISTNCVEVFGMLIAILFFREYTFLIPSQMLFINLVTDSLPAFALGVERIEDNIMTSPPRNSKSGLFGGMIGIGIVYQSILQTLIVVVVFILGLRFYSPEVANAMVFYTIIFMQLLHSVNCKSNQSVITKRILNNPTFNLCFLITLILNLSVACLPFFRSLFGLANLDASQWLVVTIASIIIIPACELMKLILNPIDSKKPITKEAKIQID